MTAIATGNRMTAEIARQSRLGQDIVRTQISISTGKRLQSASEDPRAAARTAQIARAQANDATWSSNLSLASSLAAQADTALATLSERMIEARIQTLSGATATASAADRATIAASLRSIAGDVAALRGTQTSLGTPLFAPGQALATRVDAATTLVPVASASAVFDRGAIALTDDLAEAAAALESGDATRIGAALTRLDDALTHVTDAAADQGSRAARIDRLSDATSAREIDHAAERSVLEDTDILSAVARLNAQQLTLEAAQAAFARIGRRTLFDILG